MCKYINHIISCSLYAILNLFSFASNLRLNHGEIATLGRSNTCTILKIIRKIKDNRKVRNFVIFFLV